MAEIGGDRRLVGGPLERDGTIDGTRDGTRDGTLDGTRRERDFERRRTPPRSPDDDDAFVEAAARVVARRRRRSRSIARDRAPDLHVPSGGNLPHHHHAPPAHRRTPHDALAAALTDPCGAVRVAATAADKSASKADLRRAPMHLLLPNLRARDACLREATARALTALWTEEHGAMGAVAAGKGGAARAETAAGGMSRRMSKRRRNGGQDGGQGGCKSGGGENGGFRGLAPTRVEDEDPGGDRARQADGDDGGQRGASPRRRRRRSPRSRRRVHGPPEGIRHLAPTRCAR